MDGSLLYSKYLDEHKKVMQSFGFFSEVEQNNVQTDPMKINRTVGISMMALIDTIAPYIEDTPVEDRRKPSLISIINSEYCEIKNKKMKEVIKSAQRRCDSCSQVAICGLI